MTTWMVFLKRWSEVPCRVKGFVEEEERREMWMVEGNSSEKVREKKRVVHRRKWRSSGSRCGCQRCEEEDGGCMCVAGGWSCAVAMAVKEEG